MKKYLSLGKWKHYSAKQAARATKCKLRKIRYERRKRIPFLGKEDEQASGQNKNESFITNIAPNNFSFIQNTDEVISFFDKSKDIIQADHDLFVDIKNIDIMTPDTVALLCATVNDPHFKKNKCIRGNAPTKESLYSLFKDSGFYNHVTSDDRNKISNLNVFVHKITNNRVENIIARDVCERAISKLFSQPKKFRPLYEILIELMANTNNHANPDMVGTYNWWLFMDCNNEKTVSISFLDLGVGIIKSGPVQNYIKTALKVIGARSDADLINDIFHGRLKSRTKLSERGKGLPSIFHHSKNVNFTKFFVITNRAFVNLKNDTFIELNNNFQGTFWYFELSAESA